MGGQDPGRRKPTEKEPGALFSSAPGSLLIAKNGNIIGIRPSIVVSRRLTTVAPQPLHRIQNPGSFPGSQLFDRIVRNEAVAVVEPEPPVRPCP